MSNSLLPLHAFSPERRRDLPFEIGRIETLSSAALSSRPHRHNFYEVFWITGGSGRDIIDFEPYPILENTLYFITPGQVHSWSVECAIIGYALLFTEEFLPTRAMELLTPRSFDFFPPSR